MTALRGELFRPGEVKKERLRRLQNEQLRFYQPHPIQEKFHKSLAKIRGLFGGNQSGKTKAGAVEILWTVGKVHPYRPNFSGPVYGRDCCVDFGTVVAVLLPHYRELMPWHSCTLPGKTFEGKPREWPGLRGDSWDTAYDRQEKILYLADDSIVEFKSYDQGWEKFQGARRHIIREDEEPSQKRIHDENIARQARYGTNLIISMTPLNPSQWLYSDIYEQAAGDDDYECFMMSTAENPYVDRGVISMMEKTYKDPAEREARLYGKFTFLAGLVYKGYGEHNLVDPFPIPRDWDLSFVIDPHPQKATAWNLFAESPDGKIYIIDEADIEGDVEQICQVIRARCADKRIGWQMIDPAAGEQGARIHGRGKLIDEFRKHLPKIVKAKNAVYPGVNAVQQLVADGPGGPRLQTFRSCPVTHFQMKNLSWKGPTPTGEDRKRAEIVKRNEDHCDCVRYRIYTAPPGQSIQNVSFNIGVYAN